MNKHMKKVGLALALALGTSATMATAANITCCTPGCETTISNTLSCNNATVSYVNSATANKVTTNVVYVRPPVGTKGGNQGKNSAGQNLAGCSVSTAGGTVSTTTGCNNSVAKHRFFVS